MTICRLDDLIHGNMPPYVAWQRTKTTVGGDACCDFCVARETKQQNAKHLGEVDQEF